MAEKAVLALDIGGTYAKAGVFTQKGLCLATGRFKTHGRDLDTFLDSLICVATELKKSIPRSKYTLCGVAAGVPSYNNRTQRVEYPPNLAWPSYTPLAELMREGLGMESVVVLNDADAAILGEWVYGKGKASHNFGYLTLGTGLGSAFVLGGHLLQSSHGMVAEMGHICLVKEGRACGCGMRGCLETYVSATGLRQTYCELISKKESPPHKLSIKQIAKACQAGDPDAQMAFRKTGLWLGEALGMVGNILAPEFVFLAGGLATVSDLFIGEAKEAMNARLVKGLQGYIQIEPSGLLKENPALLGLSHAFFHGLSAPRHETANRP